VIAALLVALVVVVSKMPNTNPLKRILTVSLTKTIKAAQAPIRAFVLLGTELSMAFARLVCRRNDSGRSQATSSSSRSALACFRSSAENTILIRNWRGIGICARICFG